MKKILSIFLVITLLSSILIGCNNTEQLNKDVKVDQDADKNVNEEENKKIVILDAEGKEVIFDKMPKKIVPISYSIALVMHGLGIEIEAMTSTKRPLPDELKNIPKVGSPMRPDIERILAIQPDVVIMSPRFLEKHKQTFEEHNIKYLALKNDTYQDTKKLIKDIGEAFGAKEKAKQMLDEFKKREEVIMDKIKGKKAPKVMIIHGAQGMFTLARDITFTGSLVKMLGGINVTESIPFEENLGAYIPFSQEKVVEMNPDVILRISHGDSEQTRKIFEHEFNTNPVWKEINAVKNGRVYDLDNTLFFANPGLKSIDSLEYIAEILYFKENAEGGNR
ncbi:ABC transporter substrate-binding protein [Caloranaerobacter azorensis]|uniref:ABC transporter substrate-binding protein n=1 Tax=Caloranaerobacter azorensis TaxID=116090 RepID=A0A6P1YFX6_9FIRM|nr:ABC transporter substrate-binding protein [Caloranaerobacter azorensis]QIB27832.1 ABC transporter substrate-binding protein [Caloranaerobacter azorensis]